MARRARPRRRIRPVFSAAALAKLTVDQRELLTHKEIGGTNFRIGSAYQAGYVAYRTILLAVDDDENFSLRDDIGCFVDELVIERGGRIEFCQAKSGDPGWQNVRRDLNLQASSDQVDKRSALYTVVVAHDTLSPRRPLTVPFGSVHIERFGEEHGTAGYQGVAERHPEFVDAARSVARSEETSRLSDLYERIIGFWLTATRVMNMRTLVERILHESMDQIPFAPIERGEIEQGLADVLDEFELEWHFSGRYLRLSGHQVTLYVLEPVGTAVFAEFSSQMRNRGFASGWELVEFVLEFNQMTLDAGAEQHDAV